MKKPVLTGLLIAAVAALFVLFVVMRSAVQETAENAAPAALKDLTVTLEGQTFVLKDGVAQLDAAPGSTTTNTVRIVGEPVTGDASGGGERDAALLLENDPGGSGTFYYAVLAINRGGSYQATNAVALGDRITPRGIDFIDGHFVYRFLERKPGEPLVTAPSVDKSVTINLDATANRISAAP